MKIKCDFCKTEYSLNTPPQTPVKCAICGHVWTAVSPNARRRATLTFIAATCALLSAVVFVFAIITRSRMNDMQNTPLIAELISADLQDDDNGIARFVVRGRITNISDEIYGVPDLIIVSHDDHGTPIARQRIMPPATLLDVNKSVEFTTRLNTPTAGVKKITIEMQTQGDMK